MRVSDLVKDVIFLVGSMECFSQVGVAAAAAFSKGPRLSVFLVSPRRGGPIRSEKALGLKKIFVWFRFPTDPINLCASKLFDEFYEKKIIYIFFFNVITFWYSTSIITFWYSTSSFCTRMSEFSRF